MNKQPGTVKVLELGGIPLLVHWSVAAGAILLALFMQFDVIASLSVCFAYFFLIVLHEAAHAVAARSQGLKVSALLISGIGGFCQFQAPTSYRSAFIVTSAGLLAQAFLLLYAVAYLAVFGNPGSGAGVYVVRSFIYLNAAMIVLNLIPSKPRQSITGTDGYLLWKLTVSRRRRLPFAWPDTSATFSPDTQLSRVSGFVPADFETGIEILNDNATPMDFVVRTLMTHLQLAPDEAIRLMLSAHEKGGLLIALPSHETAEAVANAIAADALTHGHKLVCRAVYVQRSVLSVAFCAATAVCLEAATLDVCCAASDRPDRADGVRKRRVGTPFVPTRSIR